MGIVIIRRRPKLACAYHARKLSNGDRFQSSPKGLKEIIAQMDHVDGYFVFRPISAIGVAIAVFDRFL